MKLINYFKQAVKSLRVILRETYYQQVALIAALVLAWGSYWLFSQVSTWSDFWSMAEQSQFGKYSISYALVYWLLTILTVIAFGFSTALLVWQYKHSRFGRKGGVATNGLGAAVSAAAAACPVCGAFLLNALGIASGVSLLPFKGLELKLASLGLLVAAIIITAKRVGPAIDKQCLECAAPAVTPPGAKNQITSSKALIYLVTASLLINHLMIGQVARGFGLIKSTNNSFSSFFKLNSSRNQIFATKLNPDGRTTTVALFTAISEVPKEPNTGDVVADAKAVMVPTGAPFYAPAGISFDDAVGALKQWGRYEDSIRLVGDLDQRWNKIVGQMTCDYCCGSPNRVTIITNCGCAHSKAYRGLAKYLLQNYGDKYADEEILGELERWKGAWYPAGTVEDYLLATGRGNIIGHKSHGGAGPDNNHGFSLNQ